VKWILYIMLFSTPAANVTNHDDITCLKKQDPKDIKEILNCRPKFETKHVWSLQGTSQIEFALFESCVRMQDLLFANTNVASTMTLRAWCFCEAANGQKCPTDAKLREAANAIRDCEKEQTPTCRQNNSNQIQNFVGQGEQNSSSIRLYPPEQ